MESNFRINNDIGLSSKQALETIEDFFINHLNHFKLVKKYDLSSGHWGLSFTDKESKITIQSDLGFLDYLLIDKNKKINLAQYNPLIKGIRATSFENIQILLHTIELYYAHTLP